METIIISRRWLEIQEAGTCRSIRCQTIITMITKWYLSRNSRGMWISVTSRVTESWQCFRTPMQPQMLATWSPTTSSRLSRSTEEARVTTWPTTQPMSRTTWFRARTSTRTTLWRWMSTSHPTRTSGRSWTRSWKWVSSPTPTTSPTTTPLSTTHPNSTLQLSTTKTNSQLSNLTCQWEIRWWLRAAVTCGRWSDLREKSRIGSPLTNQVALWLCLYKRSKRLRRRLGRRTEGSRISSSRGGSARYTRRQRWGSRWMGRRPCSETRPLPHRWISSHLYSCRMLGSPRGPKWWRADRHLWYRSNNRSTSRGKSRTYRIARTSKKWSNSRWSKSRVSNRRELTIHSLKAISMPYLGGMKQSTWASRITTSPIWCSNSSPTRSRISWLTLLCQSARPGHPDALRSFHALPSSLIGMAKARVMMRWTMLGSRIISRSTSSLWTLSSWIFFSQPTTPLENRRLPR